MSVARNSLTDLQQRACLAIFEGSVFRQAPGTLIHGAELPPRCSTEAERKAVQTVISEGVIWLHAKLPDRKSREARNRFQAQVADMAEQRISLVCGAGVVVGAILSWLIGQALSWLWNWWRETDDAPQLVCGMVLRN